LPPTSNRCCRMTPELNAAWLKTPTIYVTSVPIELNPHQSTAPTSKTARSIVAHAIQRQEDQHNVNINIDMKAISTSKDRHPLFSRVHTVAVGNTRGIQAGASTVCIHGFSTEDGPS
jgi:hypothetical protein